MTDTTFRIILVAVFIVHTVSGFYFWRKSKSDGEKIDRRKEGLFILIGIRLLSGIYGIGVVAWLINPDGMAWASLQAPLWLRWIGVGLVVIAASLVAWGLHTLGKNFTDSVVTKKEHTLVTSGPYRFVRHPLYSCYFLIVLGTALLMANWFPAVAGGVVLTLVVIRTRTEEQKLIERFGDEYRLYMSKTSRFLPRIFSDPHFFPFPS